jgi:hypothetical protein
MKADGGEGARAALCAACWASCLGANLRCARLCFVGAPPSGRAFLRQALPAIAAGRRSSVFGPFPLFNLNLRFRPAGRASFGIAPKEAKRASPAAGPCALRSVPLLRRRSRAAPRRAIPGLARLERHPCRSTPCTTTALGRAKGRSTCLEVRVGAMDAVRTAPSPACGMKAERGRGCSGRAVRGSLGLVPRRQPTWTRGS